MRGACAAVRYSEHMFGLVWLVGLRVSQLVRGLGLLLGCKLGRGTYNIRCLSVCLLYKPFYISLPDLVWDPPSALPGPEGAQQLVPPGLTRSGLKQRPKH